MHLDRQILLDSALGWPVDDDAAEHLRGCASCQADVDDLRRVVDRVRQTPRTHCSLLRRGSRRPLSRRSTMVAAACVAGIGLGSIGTIVISRHIGVIPSGATETTFPVSRQFIDDGYVVVDISRGPLDGKPQHSGDSLARGTLP